MNWRLKMFGFLFNKKNKLFAPVDGKLINLSSVSDEVFSKKIVGDGIAIIPTSNIIKSPVTGTLKTIFRTNHAFTIIDENEIEIIVHVGIDTVDLKGNGFERIIQENKKVEKGTPILKIDLDSLISNNKNIETPILIANLEKISKIEVSNKSDVVAGVDEILSYSLK
jgi:glucose-specific phosphotransferase system IIA component